MSTRVVYVGLDVHKDSIAIAVAREGREMAESQKTIPNDAVRLRKALKMLVKDGQVLKVCYEAGPTGFDLYRRLRAAAIDCIVVAPSLVPGKPGDRVKTDRRDARRLAHFLRSGDLTQVYVPDEAVEAIRDLERARDDAKCAERVARHQLSKFLLRHGRHWEGTARTRKHLDWIRTQKSAFAAQQRVLEDYLKTVEDLAERVERLTTQVAELVQETTLAPLVQALQAFRGISVVSAVTIAAEVGDLRRFTTAGQFMSYVGLVPSEDSARQRRRQGAMTRCGNAYMRRILVEAAWHYRHAPVMSKELRRRNQGIADGVRRIAWEAQKRLNKRMYHLIHQRRVEPPAAKPLDWFFDQAEEAAAQRLFAVAIAGNFQPQSPLFRLQDCAKCPILATDLRPEDAAVLQFRQRPMASKTITMAPQSCGPGGCEFRPR